MTPDVSVIVPVFQQWHTLPRCLAALAAQTYHGALEVLVIVNEPLDPLRAMPVVSGLCTHYRFESTIGSYAARNAGIRAAQGALLAFTDADCVPAPDWIAKGVEALQRLPGPGFVGGNVDVVVHNAQRPTIAEVYECAFGFDQRRYVEQLGFAVTANLFTTRQTVQEVGLFDDRLFSGGDVEWGQRVTARGFAHVYAHDVVVRHPARRTLGELSARAQRVAGGVQQLMDRRGIGLAGAWRHLAHDAALASVIVFVTMVRALECVRVHFGAIPRR